MKPDTVNVPREPTPEMIAAACGDREEHPVMKYLTPDERGGAAIFPLAYWRAMLAAAPKAGPVNSTGPASDELLEAAVNLQSARTAHSENPIQANAMTVREASENLDSAIAKHKGPQS